jgi:hypothetical protein
MQLHFTKELTDPYLAEIGTPYRVFRDAGGRFLAVCSKLPSPSVPGVVPPIRPSFCQRVSLYLDGSMALLATVEFLFPVQDITFHPTDSLLAIGTGSYDGRNYEGQLLLWNWETNRCESLLAESREVVRVRFEESGTLAILLRPRDEEEFLPSYQYPSTATFVGTNLQDLKPRPYLPTYGEWSPDPRLADLRPIDPAKLGFDTPEPFNRLQLPVEEFALAESGFKHRGAINDLLWLTDKTFAVTHSNCLVECWELSSGLQSSLPCSLPGLTHGHELLPTSDGSAGFWVNEVEDHWGVSVRPKEIPHSRIHHWQDARVLSSRVFDAVGTVMRDSSGNFLLFNYQRCQLWLNHSRQPVSLSPSTFDSSGCFYPVAGATQFHFLKIELSKRPGTVSLTRLGSDNVLEVLWTQSESNDEMRGWSSTNLVINGERIILCRTRVECGRTAEAFVECRQMATGRLLWSLAASSFKDIHTLCFLPESQAIVFASGDGMIGLINATDGQLLDVLPIEVAGVPTVITALAARGNQLLAGTLEGRLLLYTIHN